MTLPTILLAIASAAVLTAIGVADPKRRRARGLPPAAPRRGAALGALAICGVGVAASAGPAGVVVWASAVAVAGWTLTLGLARLPSPLSRIARVDPRNPASPSCSGFLAGKGGARTATRRIALPAALPLVALLCGLLALEVRRGASAERGSSERIAALGLLDRIERGAPARRAAAPCLVALAALRDAAGLRDLLAERAATLAVPAAGRAGTALQRCILAAGGEGADVARDGDGTVYALDADTSARIHALIMAPLDDAEALAALIPAGGVGAGLLCRRLGEAAGPEIAGLVEALRRDRAYSKADELIERLPALDRLLAARRAGAPCPA